MEKKQTLFIPTMIEDKVEGIVLRSQDYKERQRIITIFTPLGVLSLVVKGISSKNTRLLALTTPFSYAEYHFIKKNSDLLSFQDGIILNEHLELRRSLQSLKTAGALAQTILSSQWPGKASFPLFSLYKAYHAQVPRVANWQALLASFYLKLLRLEGAFECPSGFSSSELDKITLLGSLQQFSALDGVEVPCLLLGKVEKLLADSTR